VVLVFSIIYTQGFSLSLIPLPVHAQEQNFEQFLLKTTPAIQEVTTDSQAQKLVQSTMGPFAQATLNSQMRNRKKQNVPLPDFLTKKMLGLATATAMWHFASELEKFFQSGRESQSSFLLPKSNTHLDWVKNSSTLPELHRVIQLTEIYGKLDKVQESQHSPLPLFANYAQYLHQQYSTRTNGNLGWLTIAEKEGTQGITQRLYEFWKIEAENDTTNHGISVTDQESYAARYLHQHYLPLHQAFLHTALVKLQIEAERQARAIWSELRQWQKDQAMAQGLFRLCGTWQWLIHNHQNHGDHKTLMIYPPPSQYDRMDPRPATIQVQGDTVYIRWEFPRGIIQEESLLFSEKDRALSGTFVNNLGPIGNITARLVKQCSEG
jgi:hypothetical protein